MKNGKDMSRELLGVNFQSTISKSKSLNSPLGEEISLKTFFDHSNVWNPLSIINTGYLQTPPFHKTSKFPYSQKDTYIRYIAWNLKPQLYS